MNIPRRDRKASAKARRLRRGRRPIMSLQRSADRTSEVGELLKKVRAWVDDAPGDIVGVDTKLLIATVMFAARDEQSRAAGELLFLEYITDRLPELLKTKGRIKP